MGPKLLSISYMIFDFSMIFRLMKKKEEEMGSKEINEIRRMVEVGKSSDHLDLQTRIALQNRVEDAASRYATGELDAKGNGVVRTEQEERELKAFRSKQQKRYLKEIIAENVDMGMESEEAIDDAFEQLEAQYGRSNVLISKADI